MYTFAPVGLLSLSAMVRQFTKWQVELFDINRHIRAGNIPCNDRFYENSARLLLGSKPDVVGFMTECDSYHHVLQTCDHLKRLKPSCQIVLGGPHASAVADGTMEHWACIDSIVKGEGEHALIALLDQLESHALLPPAHRLKSGILLRNQEGLVQHFVDHRLVENLDDLPIPAYDLYTPEPGEEIFMEVGRGCPFSCEFCSTAPFWNRKHRVKSPQRIVQEIALLRQLFSVERLHFTHDLFTTDRTWVMAVCEALLKENINVMWTCSARTDTVDPALLRLMKAAGCRAIYFGIESGSERILKQIRKNIPVKHSLSMIKECAAAGIVPNVGFILGLPTEDESSMRDTFAAYTDVLRMGAKPVHIFGYCPFAQSSIMSNSTKLLLRHDSHYVDIPLGSEADTANRALIGSSQELFGSYFRIVAEPALDSIEGIDEFSPLVEATVVPTLLVADLVDGGMFQLYKQWLGWIRRKNEVNGKQPWRRSYGSAIDYASFLREYLQRCVGAPGYLDDLLRATEIGLRAAQSPQPTSMDSYRSFSHSVLRAYPNSEDVVSRSDIAALAKFSYDISGLIADNINVNEPKVKLQPTYLVWQRQQDRVRLLQVNSFLYSVLVLLERTSVPVSDLSVLDPSSAPDDNIDQLLYARSVGLLTIHHEGP